MALGWLLGAVLAGQADPEDVRIRALVNDLMIADAPAAHAPVYSLPPLVIPGEPPPNVDPRDPRIAAYAAVEKLGALGMKAWPFLLERIDDRRQSIAMAAEIPCTVGRTCFHLIADDINPRAPRGHFDDYDLLLDGDDLRVWWAERKGRELRDLKTEAARFAWALADFDGQYVDHYAALLKELGMEDPAAGAEPWRTLAAKAKTPDDPAALVSLLAKAKDGDFLSRRIAKERGGRAWSKLYNQELKAFPALARGLEDAAVAERCFQIMKSVLHPYGIQPHEDAMIIATPAAAEAWWRTRQGRTLTDLQLEAARHARAGLAKKSMPREEKKSLLKFMDEQIRKIDEGR